MDPSRGWKRLVSQRKNEVQMKLRPGALIVAAGAVNERLAQMFYSSPQSIIVK